MKKIVYIICLIALATSANAQQKQVYERTKTGQVLSDWATWSRYYLGLPKGSAPVFPAYVPDSVKTGALFYRTGATNSGLKVYDGSSWVPVGVDYSTVIGAKADSARLYGTVIPGLQTSINGKASLTANNRFSGENYFNEVVKFHSTAGGSVSDSVLVINNGQVRRIAPISSVDSSKFVPYSTGTKNIQVGHILTKTYDGGTITFRGNSYTTAREGTTASLFGSGAFGDHVLDVMAGAGDRYKISIAGVDKYVLTSTGAHKFIGDVTVTGKANINNGTRGIVVGESSLFGGGMIWDKSASGSNTDFALSTVPGSTTLNSTANTYFTINGVDGAWMNHSGFSMFGFLEATNYPTGVAGTDRILVQGSTGGNFGSPIKSIPANSYALATSYTTNAIYKGNGTTTPVVSSLTDDGTTVSGNTFTSTSNIQSAPTPTGSGIVFGKDAFTNAFAFMGSNGKVAWFSSANLTGNTRVYIPNADGKTLATIDGSQTFTSGVWQGTAIADTYISSSANWNTSYTDRLKWDGGSTGLVASTGRTSLGGTTVGQNLFTLTNPSANTFLRVNADNSVSALDATTFRTAIGAGTSSTTGTVTSVAMSTPTGLSVSGGPITTSGTLALSFAAGYSLPSDATQATWTAKQAALSGTGFVKISGTTITYDNTDYLGLHATADKATNWGDAQANFTSTITSGFTGVPVFNPSTSKFEFATIASLKASFNLSADYQPLENQRLSTSNSPTFAGVTSINGGFLASGISTTFQFANTNGTPQTWQLGQDVAGIGDGIFYLYDNTSSTFGMQIAKNKNVSFYGNITTTGTFSASGYNKTNWDAAYGWGDHSSAGYLTPASNLAWAKLTGKPTTIAGYGITDYNSLGDARWVSLGGSYSNPSWINAIAASKITGLATVATTGSYSDLSGKPTAVSSFSNDAGYLTPASNLAWAKLTGVPNTIAGYGITDFNSLGDARWAPVGTTASYSEGTWTPGATTGVTTSSGRYTKIGNMVYATFNVATSASASGSTFQITGLPFGSSANSIGSVIISSQTVLAAPITGSTFNGTAIYFQNGATYMTDNQFSSKGIVGTVIYSVSN